MFFGKKKRMIDIGRLQRSGAVILPKEEPRGPETDDDGFVDLGKNTSSEKAGFFEFLGKQPPSSSSSNSSSEFSTETNGYNKREVDQKISDLDNKIYRLEQRIELLERKAGVGVGSGNSSDSTPIGW